MGKADLYRRRLGMFRDRERDFAERFDTARAQRDTATCTRCAHDLKSVAGTRGMPGLQRAAAALEAACEQGAGSASVEMLLDTVTRQLRPLLEGLAPLLDRSG